MSFGLSFTNNQDVVVLDSEYARLSIISSGRYAPTSDLTSVTYFVRPVTSQEPPLVFIRPDTVAAIGSATQMSLLGSAGNWTGFHIRGYSVNTAPTNGRYFVGAFAAQPVAAYGMKLWDAASNLIFDSGTPSAIFTRSFINWTYVKSVLSDTGSYINYYTVPFDFPESEYLMINSFGMNLLGGSVGGRTISTWWDFPSATLWAITNGFNNPYDFHLPAIFAKINV